VLSGRWSSDLDRVPIASRIAPELPLGILLPNRPDYRTTTSANR